MPKAFEQLRRFGVSQGCLAQGAFYVQDAVMAEWREKGLFPLCIALRFPQKYKGD
ncbi:paREP2a [Pyrobaculum aerophilum str. IM2]|uniref:PaREP2a n=1 Tax=Pyrobaculum aerophilum (strain ATCC 51768 / DSM 7523 / JCM 9630 / CIP 104966 / NBRC 100827 / IM2) TaxID=178306 RepID=Q8ZVV0_PYRAE|nr:paREP2a [Pyrobaculum aerophilum str. IM2]